MAPLACDPTALDRRMMALPIRPAVAMGHTSLVIAVHIRQTTAIPRAMATEHISLAIITRLATAIGRPDRTRHTTARLPMKPPTDIRQKSPPHRIYSPGTKRSWRLPNPPSSSSGTF
jgi:hypothetical protein